MGTRDAKAHVDAEKNVSRRRYRRPRVGGVFDGETHCVLVPALTRVVHLADAPEVRDESPQRVLGYAALGLGVVGIGVGVGFAVSAQSKAHEHDGLCPAGVDCAPPS